MKMSTIKTTPTSRFSRNTCIAGWFNGMQEYNTAPKRPMHRLSVAKKIEEMHELAFSL